MDILLYIVMFALGAIGSFFSGLLGIGGAIINYPLLLYVPKILEVGTFNAQEVASISMFQVLFASLAGVLAFRRQNSNSGAMINKDLVLYMGVSILAGSLMGGAGSRFLPSSAINLVYGVLAVVAVILMLIPSKGNKEETAPSDVSFNKGIAVTSAFAVGVVSGIVGAGGAFILIPIMLTILRIPTRVTIASSLAIVFISAIGGAIGKITAGHIPLLPTAFTVFGSLMGAPLGSKVSKVMNVKVLRYALVVLITVTAVKIWSGILL